MRAAVVRSFGTPEGLGMERWPDPRPEPGEVLVAVALA
jgi:NADPH:quinone reductase-like Zn-dependent oxidoreductase